MAKAKGIKMSEIATQADLTALTKMTDTVLSQSAEKILWYNKNKGWRSVVARLVRVCMIIGTLVAALIPLFSAILVDANNEQILNPAWSAIATAVVASLFAFEKYYGHANAWMRFTQAEIAITQKVEQLSLEWQDYQYRFNTEQKQEFPEWCLHLKDHQQAVFDITTTETKQWTQEFQRAMTEAYKSKKG